MTPEDQIATLLNGRLLAVELLLNAVMRRMPSAGTFFDEVEVNLARLQAEQLAELPIDGRQGFLDMIAVANDALDKMRENHAAKSIAETAPESRGH